MSKFSIVYTGAMFRDERNPTLLMEVVKQLSDDLIISTENFAIIYAGRDSKIFEKYINNFDLDKFFDNKGMLMTNEAINLQNSAHINLLLTSATKDWTGVMTGKLGEYLSSKKPLVVLINGTKDIEYENLIKNLNVGCVVYNNQSFSELKAFILDKFNEWQDTGDVKSTINFEKLLDLSWEKQVEKFVEYIHL